jgi:hypothetical protein
VRKQQKVRTQQACSWLGLAPDWIEFDPADIRSHKHLFQPSSLYQQKHRKPLADSISSEVRLDARGRFAFAAYTSLESATSFHPGTLL